MTASELATAQSFVIDLCRLLELDVPHPTPEQDYMFERPVSFRHGDGGSRSSHRAPCLGHQSGLSGRQAPRSMALCFVWDDGQVFDVEIEDYH